MCWRARALGIPGPDVSEDVMLKETVDGEFTDGTGSGTALLSGSTGIEDGCQ
jgi:hypothetical protein